MAEIRLEGLGHSYLSEPRNEHDYALKPVDLMWQDGKTYALLGPSGCGKTTMLNIISGLRFPSKGKLLFDGEDVTHKPTAERNIAQVFQFPVIYSTKTVSQNLAFPLICREVGADEVKARVKEVAELLDLTYALDMPARKLSADQKQLISLGRGLVRKDVSAILLDEPLTVIDPQLKFALRRKLREINRETGITMILVTHDQSEAMSFADEIVVMKDGQVQQSGAPNELFAKPSNEFVGYFIGSPPMNMVPMKMEGAQIIAKNLRVDFDRAPLPNAQKYSLGFRPEHIRLINAEEIGIGTGTVSKIENLGVDGIITLDLGDGLSIKAKTRKHMQFQVSDKIGIDVDANHLLVYADDQLAQSLPVSI